MGLYTGVITSIVLLSSDSVYFVKNFYLISLLWFRCKKFQARNLFRVFTKSTSMAILKSYSTFGTYRLYDRKVDFFKFYFSGSVRSPNVSLEGYFAL